MESFTGSFELNHGMVHLALLADFTQKQATGLIHLELLQTKAHCVLTQRDVNASENAVGYSHPSS